MGTWERAWEFKTGTEQGQEQDPRLQMVGGHQRWGCWDLGDQKYCESCGPFLGKPGFPC